MIRRLIMRLPVTWRMSAAEASCVQAVSTFADHRRGVRDHLRRFGKTASLLDGDEVLDATIRELARLRAKRAP